MTRILLTGGSGLAAGGIRPLLAAAGHHIVLLDRVPPMPPCTATETVVVGDLTQPVVLDRAMAGVEMVAHFGGFSSERPWDDIAHVNITGTQRVLEAARGHGVGRVLLASSTHAAGYHRLDDPLLARPRPDTFYGVGKVAAEALGSVYADRYGMTVVAARIGTIEERPSNRRSLSTWLSFPDLVRLILATSTTEARGYHLVWATSANARRWFPLEPGYAIGYHPADDAEFFADRVPNLGQGGPVDELVGGAFTAESHPLGKVW